MNNNKDESPLNKIEIDVNIFFFISISIIFLSTFKLSLDHLIDIILLSFSIFIRKELYIYKNITFKIDFFRLILLYLTLQYGLVYSITVTNISIISSFIIKKIFGNSNKLYIPELKIKPLETLQEDIIKQKENEYFVEYSILFATFILSYLLFENIPMIKDGFIIFFVSFMSIWVILETILNKIYNKSKLKAVNEYVRKFFSSKDKINIYPIILEITLHSIFSISIFYTYANTKLYILILFLIFLLSFRDKTYISNQLLTFISLIVNLLEKKDRYTFDHSYRVALISYNIAKQLKMNLNDIDRIYKSAIIHDIGKIIIPDEILQKKGKLTKEEFEIIKLHVKELKNILEPIYEFIKDIVDIAELHHERLDGNGYPYGYKSNQIPLESRILAIADTFDALIIDRPYRPGFSFQKAFSILKEDTEKNKLDKYLVEIFIKTIPQTEIIESIKKVKTMIRIYQGKIINNMISSLSDFIDEII